MYLKKWLEELPMLLLLLLLALLPLLLPGFISVCRAQGAAPPGQALGQPVPGNIPLRLVNAERTTARIADYRGKLLLLDFYATWCSSSRAPLPRLDSLQRQFGDSLQVLLVSYRGARDTEASVQHFMDTWRTPVGTPLHLPSAVEDTTLIKLFPHRRIPHFAWVAPNGTLGAVTGQGMVTEANVRRALRSGQMPPSLRADVDLSQPLLSGGIVLPEAQQHYSVLLQGPLDDGPPRSELRREEGQLTGMVLVNTPLLQLYESIKRRLYPDWGSWGLELAAVDSASLYLEKSSLPEAEWKAANVYAYELQVPPTDERALYRYLLEDLNRFSGYRAVLVSRAQDCLALVRKGRQDRLRSKGGPAANRLYRPQQPELQHQPLSLLVARLNSNKALPLRVLDETGYTDPVDIAFPEGIRDLESLRRQLKPYGLDLVPKRRRVPVLLVHPVGAAGSGQ